MDPTIGEDVLVPVDGTVAGRLPLSACHDHIFSHLAFVTLELPLCSDCSVQAGKYSSPLLNNGSMVCIVLIKLFRKM